MCHYTAFCPWWHSTCRLGNSFHRDIRTAHCVPAVHIRPGPASVTSRLPTPTDHGTVCVRAIVLDVPCDGILIRRLTHEVSLSEKDCSLLRQGIRSGSVARADAGQVFQNATVDGKASASVGATVSLFGIKKTAQQLALLASPPAGDAHRRAPHEASHTVPLLSQFETAFARLIAISQGNLVAYVFAHAMSALRMHFTFTSAHGIQALNHVFSFISTFRFVCKSCHIVFDA